MRGRADVCSQTGGVSVSLVETLQTNGSTRRVAALVGAVKAWRASTSHASQAQRTAGAAFLIRVGAAALAYLSQVALARWMGTYHFGIYVYVWTWALLIGGMADAGLSSAAQRFIPSYLERKEFARLRGFISGSRWLAVGFATGLAALGALMLLIGAPYIDSAAVIPLYLACLCLPVYALSSVQDGIARCWNWTHVGLMPTFVLRPILLLALMGGAYAAGFETSATTAIICSVISYWLIGIAQFVALDRKLATAVMPGPRAYETGLWLKTSLPIVMVVGFYVMLTYVDIIILQWFRPPDVVAYYYAATKTLTLVSFVYFSVSAATAHRFSQYHAAGDQGLLREFVGKSIRWTFWPSVAVMAVIIALGQPLLTMFGGDFTRGYPLMFIMGFGLLARASVGPAERLLSMLDEQKACALIYATAFAVNLVGCLLLIPHYGAVGAATATSLALITESALLFWIARQRLGIHAFVV
jgi:O-antigen/teichoic acid export membrane protein